MDDKRQFVRFEAPLYVKYNLEHDNRQLQGIAQNISMGGAMVAVDQSVKLKPATALEIYFLLPENTLAVNGKVAWVKDADAVREIGVRFNEFPDACKEALYQHIFKHHRSEIVNKWWQV